MNVQVAKPIEPRVSASAPAKRTWMDWAAWFSLPVLVVLCTGAHIGKALTYGFTPAAVVVGAYFLRKSAPEFVSFLVALFAFTGFVRRIAEFTSAFSLSSPILLAPYFVAGLVVFVLFRPAPPRLRMLPILLATLAVAYGLVIGVVSVRELSVAKSGVRWAVVLLFGLYALRQSDDAKLKIRDAILQSIVICAVIGAAYGIIQYVFAPPWDTQWLIATQETGAGISFGTAAPFAIRVFSFMNTPGGCANFCSLGILCALRFRSIWKYPIMGLLFTTLALTMIRTVWISTVVLALALLWTMPSRQKRQLMIAAPIALVLILMLVIPLFNSPAGANIAERISSFGSLKDDTSVNVRSEAIGFALDILAKQPFGKGIGYMDSSYFPRTIISTIANAGAHDIGAVEIPFELGYAGAFLYIVGMLFASVRLGKILFTGDQQDSLLAAIGLNVWLLLASSNPMVAFEGLLFWTASGLLMKSTELDLLDDEPLGYAEDIPQRRPLPARARARA